MPIHHLISPILSGYSLCCATSNNNIELRSPSASFDTALAQWLPQRPACDWQPIHSCEMHFPAKSHRDTITLAHFAHTLQPQKQRNHDHTMIKSSLNHWWERGPRLPHPPYLAIHPTPDLLSMQSPDREESPLPTGAYHSASSSAALSSTPWYPCSLPIPN